jgi:hypothetical protein
MRNFPLVFLSFTLLTPWQSAVSSQAQGSGQAKPEQSVVKPQGERPPAGGQSQEPECE